MTKREHRLGKQEPVRYRGDEEVETLEHLQERREQASTNPHNSDYYNDREEATQ